jgi:UDP-N-acetyl-D-galactosamine dehydrogenase
MIQRIAVVGLGYVGLSLATGLARRTQVVGFDVDTTRIDQLRTGYDRNAMIAQDALVSPNLEYVSDPTRLSEAEFLIVAVPTPVTDANKPDLSALKAACETVGAAIKRGSTVVFESTVYPGCTEEVCQPILERVSGLIAGQDFGLGYSPERIDPGNASQTLESVVKLVAGIDERTTALMVETYGSVVEAGVYQAASIRTAEAAKVIENVQRDLNIALMNELAGLFNRLGLDSSEVLAAAGTKWNFGHYYPGLVGGHCIPVDPYYLVHKAQQVGFHTELISAARRVNDRMGAFVATEAIKRLMNSGKRVAECKAIVLGLTFKEDVRDIRNSKVFDIIQELESFGLETWVHDPLVDIPDLAERTVSDPFSADIRYDLVVLAVPHAQYQAISGDQFVRLGSERDGPPVIADVRGTLSGELSSDSRVVYWRL